MTRHVLPTASEPAETPRRRRPRDGKDVVTVETAREWAQRTRAEQGLPLHVTDPGVIHRVLTLMGRTHATRLVRGSERDPAA